MQDTYRSTSKYVVVARGEKSLLCDPGSELRLTGREKRGEDNKWDGSNEKKIGLSFQRPHLDGCFDLLRVLFAYPCTQICSQGVTWLSYTYLHVRMRRNPMAYRVPLSDREADPQLLDRRRQLITQAAETLDDHKVVTGLG